MPSKRNNKKKKNSNTSREHDFNKNSLSSLTNSDCSSEDTILGYNSGATSAAANETSNSVFVTNSLVANVMDNAMNSTNATASTSANISKKHGGGFVRMRSTAGTRKLNVDCDENIIDTSSIASSATKVGVKLYQNHSSSHIKHQAGRDEGNYLVQHRTLEAFSSDGSFESFNNREMWLIDRNDVFFI